MRQRRRDSFERGFSIERWLTAPFRWLARHWPRRDDELGPGERGGPVDWLRQGLAAPFYLLAAGAVFLATVWAGSRRARPFAWGLPAVMIAAGMFASQLVFNYFEMRILGRYDRAAFASAQAGKFDEAVGYMRTVCRLAYPKGIESLPAEETDFVVRLAAFIAEAEGEEAGMQMMRLVSPPDAPGNLEGHLWTARVLLSKPEALTEEQFSLARRHLEQALAADLDQDDLGVRRVWVDYWMKRGNSKEAIPHLRFLFSKETAYLPLLLELLKANGMEDEFRATYSAGTNRLATLAPTHLDQIELWTALLSAHMLADDYPAALRTMQEAAQVTHPRVKSQLFGRFSLQLLQWYDEGFSFEDERAFKQGLLRLTMAVHFLPSNRGAHERLLNLTADPKFDEQRRRWLVESTQFDGQAYVTHLLVAVDAIRGQGSAGIETARVHWTIASGVNPLQACVVLGTMCRTLAVQGEKEQQLALNVLDATISFSPAQTTLQEFRGLVLADLKRWDEARQQLEAVLPQATLRQPVLITLVEICRQMGDTSQAVAYERQLAELAGPAGGF